MSEACRHISSGAEGSAPGALLWPLCCIVGPASDRQGFGLRKHAMWISRGCSAMTSMRLQAQTQRALQIRIASPGKVREKLPERPETGGHAEACGSVARQWALNPRTSDFPETSTPDRSLVMPPSFPLRAFLVSGATGALPLAAVGLGALPTSWWSLAVARTLNHFGNSTPVAITCITTSSATNSASTTTDTRININRRASEAKTKKARCSQFRNILSGSNGEENCR